MKCPECGGELYKLPNNPKRMRCKACSAVFDTNQIERLYGLKSGDKVHVGVASYETQNMHAKHQAGGAGSGYSNAVKEPTTVSLESGFGAKQDKPFENDDLRTIASQMISRAENAKQPKQTYQQPNQKKQTSSGKIVAIVILIIVVLNLPTMCIALFEDIIDDVETSTSNLISNTNTTSDYRQKYTEGISKTVLFDCKPAATLYYVDDYDGTVAIVNVTWVNESGRRASTYLTLDVVAEQDGKELNDAYYYPSGDVKYDSDLMFSYIDEHKNGYAQYSFDVDPNKPLTVKIYSGSDVFEYTNPPSVDFTFDTAASTGKDKLVQPK